MKDSPSIPGTQQDRSGESRGRLLDAFLLGLAALVLRLPAYFAERGLTFDDGVFSLSAIAMRNGGVPFRDVFSSQGPLFLPLVWLGDLLGGRNLDSTRVLAVASGVTAVVVTYVVARRCSDRLGGILAGALVATSGAFMWVTGPLAADGPALAFAITTVWLSLRMRDRPGTLRAVLLGFAIGAVLCTKSLEAPVLVVVGLVLTAPVASAARRGRVAWSALGRGALAVVCAVAVFAAVSVPFGLSEVWDQSVRYRTDAAADRDVPAAAGKLLSTMWDRDLALLFFAAVVLVCAVLSRAGSDSLRRLTSTGPSRHDESWWSAQRWSGSGADWIPSDRLLVTAWLATTAVWLVVVVSPLWRPHVAAMSIPLALLIGLYRPPARTTAAAAVLALPLVFVQLDGLLDPGEYTGTREQLLVALSELPDGSLVLSDEPGVVWRSSNRTTDDLVDPSMLRREQGRYDAATLLEAAGEPGVCAFIRISEQRFAHFAELPGQLEQIGYEAVPEVGDGSVLLVRPGCGAPG